MSKVCLKVLCILSASSNAWRTSGEGVREQESWETEHS